ncbi:MAG: F0F1 ATP synthase subunit B [bacterium]
MSELITSFHIELSSIISQVVTFIATFIVLYFLVIKPLKVLMSEREDKISKGLSDARHNEEMLSSTKREYDEVLARARAEAHTIFQDAKNEAEEEKKKMLVQAGVEVETMINNGKKRLEGDKARMVEEAKREIVSLVVRATEKLLESHKDETFTDKAVSKVKNL